MNKVFCCCLLFFVTFFAGVKLEASDNRIGVHEKNFAYYLLQAKMRNEENDTSGWSRQMELLTRNPGLVDQNTILLAGVPTNKVNKDLESKYQKPHILWRLFDSNAKFVRKAYLLSSVFNNIENADKGNHYEIYLMPRDEDLISLFLELSSLERGSDLSKNLAFIAVRATPGVTKSPYNSKNMPRIIIGFTSEAKPESVAAFVAYLMFAKKSGELFTERGLGIQPRYSKRINNLIYVAYGSADYKDSEAGQKEYATKPKTLLQRFWSGPSDEAMAFPADDKPITEDQINKAYEAQLKKFSNEAQEKQLAEEKKEFFSQHQNDLLDSVLEHAPTEDEKEMFVERKWLQELRKKQIKKQNEKTFQDKRYKELKKLTKEVTTRYSSDL